MPESSYLNSSSNSSLRVRQAAFTMVELLVIIAIVAILAIVGVVMASSRQTGTVRSLLDELEGAISSAHQSAVATGRDIALVSWGKWDSGNPFRIAFGDASLLTTESSAGGPAYFKGIVKDILDGKPPVDEAKPREQTVSAVFHVSYDTNNTSPKDTIQKRARIVLSGEDAWKEAMGDSEDITTVPPFNGIMQGALDDKNNFCAGDTQDSNNISQVTIHGSTKRFSKTVFIKIVGTNASGGATANGQMGLLVLPANSASIYKFYNPGAENGDGKWRRI